MKQVGQDGGQPGGRVGAGLELVEIAQRAKQGVLNKISGRFWVPREAQRDALQHRLAQAGELGERSRRPGWLGGHASDQLEQRVRCHRRSPAHQSPRRGTPHCYG